MPTPACCRQLHEPTVLRIADAVLTRESLLAASRLVAESDRHRLHLDLSDIRVPTAAGLGQWVTLQGRLKAGGGELLLLNVRPWAHEVFSLTRLTEVLDVRQGG